jgi:hypothetical protein
VYSISGQRRVSWPSSEGGVTGYHAEAWIAAEHCRAERRSLRPQPKGSQSAHSAISQLPRAQRAWPAKTQRSRRTGGAAQRQRNRNFRLETMAAHPHHRVDLRDTISAGSAFCLMRYRRRRDTDIRRHGVLGNPARRRREIRVPRANSRGLQYRGRPETLPPWNRPWASPHCSRPRNSPGKDRRVSFHETIATNKIPTTSPQTRPSIRPRPIPNSIASTLQIRFLTMTQ